MGKKKMSGEYYEILQNRKKEEADREFRNARREVAQEKMFGKADEGSIHTKFLTADKREREKEQEIAIRKQQGQEQAAKDAVIAARARKVFVCGDARGDLAKVCAVVEAQQKKVGQFDALLCVGAFLPPPGSSTDSESMKPFFNGEKQLPLECYFVDPSAALLQSSPRGKKLGDKLFFLGAYGVREICGLRVAYLSGHYDPTCYDRLDVDFVGGAFTAKAVGTLQRLAKQKGIDVLLTCGWPSTCDHLIEDTNLRPPDLDNVPSWQLASSSGVAELCFKMEPRYHVFGTANLFYQRPPFQTPRRSHPCRCIGLGWVGSTSKQQKWLHALQLSPMEHMKQEDLKQLPAGMTPCPFNTTSKRAADAEEHPEVPAAKRSTPDSSTRPVEPEAETGEQALTSLVAGDLSSYWQGSEKLKDVPMTRDWGAEAGKAKVSAAELWLKNAPNPYVVRYTFKEEGDLGLHLSKDVPPWVLEVHEGSHAAKKAPKVPVGSIVVAVNGHQMKESLNGVYSEGYMEARLALSENSVRPIILDVQWPSDWAAPIAQYA